MYKIVLRTLWLCAITGKFANDQSQYSAHALCIY